MNMIWPTQTADKEKFNPNRGIDFVESDYRQDLSCNLKKQLSIHESKINQRKIT